MSKLRWVASAGLAFCLAGCGDDGEKAPDSGTASSTAPWVDEADLLADPSLRVTPRQVVLLHLARTRVGEARVRHEIPYRFEDETTYTFCIPEDEEHITSAELFEERATAPLVQVFPGGECVTRAVEPGLYRLAVEHDGQGIPDEGKRAFVHVPRIKAEPQAAGGAAPGTSASPGGLAVCNALAVVTTPDGRYLVRGSGSPYPSVLAQAGSVDLASGGWQICRDANGAYGLYLTGPTPQILQNNMFGTQAIYAENDGRLTIHNNSVLPYATPFDFVDLGDFEFLFSTAAFMNAQATPANPVVVAADGTLRWTATGSPQTYGIPIKYYLPGVEPPPLQMGEVSLQHTCTTSHGTWVVRANLPTTTVYYNNPQLGTHEFLDQSTSGVLVRTGPLTVASFYAASDYRAPIGSAGADICSPLFSQFGSMKVTPARDFIIATNHCAYCNLTGIDLSGLDLSNGVFSGSTFTGANLIGTKLAGALLGGANFSGNATLLDGADFTDADLESDSTSFRGADVSQANFHSTEGLIAWFGEYRPDFTGATLSLDTFLPSDWRYINLTGATILGVHGVTLSTTANPLDLSAAVLDHVDLHGVILDGANLGCTTETPDGQPVCTSLSGTNLNRASLKKTRLVDANLQGANLDYANLDGANLCGAKLNESADTSKSASLQGTFLRNANLYQADLTGANLSNANLFSSFPNSSSTCTAASCAPTSNCASVSHATLNSATFSGAYLAGTDFSNASPQGVDFKGAFLPGANFTSANLDEDPNTGRVTNFTQAYLQGTNFTSAKVKDANFTSAYVDLSHSGSLVLQLPAANTEFAGYQHSSGSTQGCVQFSYSHATTIPPTDETNTCPNGSNPSSGSSCSQSQWTTPEVPIPALPSSCNLNTIDFNWVSG
jgi:uncharacterized protein YjbI with pentapeptide repeats